MHKCPLCKKAILIPAWKLCDDCIERRKKEVSAKKRNDKRKMLLLSQANKVDTIPSTQSEDTVSPLIRAQALS